MTIKNEKFAIKIINLSKKYILHHEKPTLAESFFRKKEEFWALKNINFAAIKGEKIGIIGPNGAGKSTLLKIIAGITIPTNGTITTVGKITSLIELDAGFEPDLTGEENIYLNGLLTGMSMKELKKNFESIIDFSGIRKFIDSPLHTYSSGMKLRLGFSIAIHSDPDILITDEILAAGDEEFRKKSYAKMQEFFKANKTIILVSHNLDSIRKLCVKTLWLDKGKIVVFGETKKVISQYLKSSNKK